MAVASPVLDNVGEYIGPIPKDVYLKFWERDRRTLLLGHQAYFAFMQREPYEYEHKQRPGVNADFLKDPTSVCASARTWWWYKFYDQECLIRNDYHRLPLKALIAVNVNVVQAKPDRVAVTFDCVMPMTSNGIKYKGYQHDPYSTWRHCLLVQFERALKGYHTLWCLEGEIFSKEMDQCVKPENVVSKKPVEINGESSKVSKLPQLHKTFAAKLTMLCRDLLSDKAGYEPLLG